MEDTATIITFPGNPRARSAGGAPFLSMTEICAAEVERAKRRGDNRYRNPARGSLPWAQSVVVAYERLCIGIAEANQAAKERRRAELPKPKFVPKGRGYEGVSVPDARRIVMSKLPNFGPEDLELIAALKAYDAKRQEWAEATARIEAAAGVDALYRQAAELREDWQLAVTIIQEAKEENYQR